MPLYTRRDFCAATSLLFARGLLGDNGMERIVLPLNIAQSPQSADALLPESTTAAELRNFAAKGVDVATQAGASYADIRVAEQHFLMLSMATDVVPDIFLRSTFTYGLRVMVNGAWAFAHGTSPSPEALVAAGKSAVATAREYSQIGPSSFEFAPIPAVTGEWRTPIHIDPFGVPLQEQSALLAAYKAASVRVNHGAPGTILLQWTREIRVLASSEGTLLTQNISRSSPIVTVGGNVGMGDVSLFTRKVSSASGGYETVAVPGMQEELKKLTEEAVRIASLPRKTIDVGRYPIVLDGHTFGAAIGQTIGPALELDRALGYESNASGLSFLSPPAEMLNTLITSPQLNMFGHRELPSFSAIGWDDEGVAPNNFPLITDGCLVDYCTSRETAPLLQKWYETQGRVVRPNGCTIAPDAGDPVIVSPPHLAVKPNTQVVGIEDLYRNIKRGLLIREANTFNTDQQLSSASLSGTGLVLEISNGKIVNRIVSSGIQFNTGRFWKSLEVVGDPTTSQNTTFFSYKGQPWVKNIQSTTAPAGLFKDVNVVSTSIRI